MENEIKKYLSVVGIGMGKITLTESAKDAIKSADAVFGAPRMIAEASDFIPNNAQRFEIYEKSRIIAAISEHRFVRSVLLVSGDVGFYSAADAFMSKSNEQAECGVETDFVPGISSLSYFAAKCSLSWQDAALISCHGRDGNIIDTVRRSRMTFALTGGNAPMLAKALTAAGFEELKVHIGERLGTKTEKITTASIREIAESEASSLSVIIIENPKYDDRLRIGIPSEEFIRGDVPMTKSEMRAIIMSKLDIKPSDRCIDIGCGTGSVTVEMALSAHRGSVLSIDISDEAVALTQKNIEKFHIGNAEVLNADAREWLKDNAGSATPQIFDAAFIGGTKGGMCDIIENLLLINKKIKIVITAITIESALEAINALESRAINPQIVQVQVSESKKAGKNHMMLAQNPIYVISVGQNIF